MQTRKFGWAQRLGLAGAALAAAVASPSASLPRQATPASGSAGTSVKVVQVVTRSPIGKMLANVKGRSLYTTAGSCTGSCLSIWPALLMPKGATTPLGAKCLATVASGKNRQVTYHGQRLYTFVDDSGSSVNGNGVGGFKAAKVTTACP